MLAAPCECRKANKSIEQAAARELPFACIILYTLGSIQNRTGTCGSLLRKKLVS